MGIIKAISDAIKRRTGGSVARGVQADDIGNQTVFTVVC